jgi:hypothetical protein
MKTIRIFSVFAFVTLTATSCGLLPQGAQDWMVDTGIGDINPEGSSGTSSSTRSKCAVCSGMGYKKDYNSGQMEMCNYCNGSGLY